MGITFLPQPSAAAEFRVIDVIAPHDPEPDPEFASCGDLRFTQSPSAPACAGRSVSTPDRGAPHGPPPRTRDSAGRGCLACSTAFLGSRPVPKGLITLVVKCAGTRSAGNPHATCDAAGAGNGVSEASPSHGASSRPYQDTLRSEEKLDRLQRSVSLGCSFKPGLSLKGSTRGNIVGSPFR